MHKRNLFFILILVLIILSTSLVSATDNIGDEADGDRILSVSDDIAIDENDEKNTVVKSDSVLGLANDEKSYENNSEKNLTSDKQILGISNNEEILGALPTYSFTSDTTARAVADKILEFNTTGGIIYLNGNTVNAINEHWYDRNSGDMKVETDEIKEIHNVKIFGGSENNPNLRATLLSSGYGFNFHGRDTGNWRETYGTSGWKLVNVTFENIDAPQGGLVNFASG